MNIPDVFVEWGLGVVSLVGGGGFLFLKGKSTSNETAIKVLAEKMACQSAEADKKLIDAIKVLGESLTPVTHCDAKQELWQVRFDSLMTQNKEQHDHIGASVSTALEGIDKQLEILFDKLEDVKDCINKIQQNKECN